LLFSKNKNDLDRINKKYYDDYLLKNSNLKEIKFGFNTEIFFMATHCIQLCLKPIIRDYKSLLEALEKE